MMMDAQRDQVVQTVILCQPVWDNMMNVYPLRCSADSTELETAEILSFDPFKAVPPLFCAFKVHCLVIALTATIIPGCVAAADR